MENNKKQTAVEWLVSEIRKLAHNHKHHLGMGDVRITQGMLDELEEQAKEMEKEQIMTAFTQGDIFGADFFDGVNITAENYYNETYKSE